MTMMILVNDDNDKSDDDDDYDDEDDEASNHDHLENQVYTIMLYR